MNPRVLAPCVIAILVPACFGHVELGSGSPPPAEAGTDGGPSTAQRCVQIDLASYDTSCQADSDCTPISTGQVCSNDCSLSCPRTLVNKDGLAQYNAATSSLPQPAEVCHCPEEPTPSCVHDKCCSDPSGCPDTDASAEASVSPTVRDASSGDAAACIEIDAGDYSSTCTQTSDCVAVSTGLVCNYDCQACVANTPINRSSKAAYDKVLDTLPDDPGVICSCPNAAPVACLGGACHFTPIPPPGG